MLYTRANYTSVTDPLTGRRKQYYFKKGSSEEMKAQFFKSFKNLTRDAGQKAYIFDDGTWQLYSNVERRRGKRGDHRERTQIKYDPSLELDTLFSKYQIEKSDSLLDQLKNRELPQTFWTSFFRILDLIMQIRNTDDESRDIILSPIGNCSREIWFSQAIWSTSSWWKGGGYRGERVWISDFWRCEWSL